MLRIIQNRSADSAKSYYSRADYLTESQELTGRWSGRGAAMLGLSGDVRREDFDRLCDNLDPRTGERLTLRTKSDRTVGYDFNFHVPKGVSIAYALNRDERIVEVFRDAVDETMRELEQEASTRVRKQDGNAVRPVSNLTWAAFIHKTARPVEGVPDPHLHAHCFVMNAVWDERERAWKAGNFRELKRDAPYYEAAFHARLASGLSKLGYGIKRQGKNWDIAEISPGIRDKFQRRTDQIEEIARKKGVTDARDKAELAAKTRESKSADLGMDQLRAIWHERLDDDERASLERAAPDRLPPKDGWRNPQAELAAVEHAILHGFERNSVVPAKRLLADALRHGVGEVSVAGVHQSLANQPIIAREMEGRMMVTTAEVLDEEARILRFAREGRDTAAPLASEWRIRRDWLNDDQKYAVEHVLASTDRVMAIRGGAGTGKTSLMKEAVEAIEAGGHAVHTFAPSAEASRGVLASEGFSSTTVAELLVSQQLQADMKHSVMWIDEAGLLSSRQLGRVFAIAEEQDARVILSGDWRQHSSPERGSPLRLLEQQGALRPALVRSIERQRGAYRHAVAAFAEGQTDEGMSRLGALGWIHEIPDADQRYQRIAEDYAQAVKDGASVLAVAPTHAEGEMLTGTIRGELRRENLIGQEEHEFLQLKPAHLTEAERRDATLLEDDMMLVFHQNAKGIRNGTRMVVDPARVGEVTEHARAFGVYRMRRVKLSEGDLIRITAGGKTRDGKHRLNNGQVYRIKKFTKEGDLILENGWQVARDFGFIAPGYVGTSYASQGKTVDRVLIAESEASFAAAGAEQIYVSVSRGRQRASIYTDDKEALHEAVARSDNPLHATELVHGDRAIADRIRAARQRLAPAVDEKPKRVRELIHERAT